MPLRLRIILPIAVIPGFLELVTALAVEIREAYAFEASFPTENFRANADASPEQFRLLRSIITKMHKAQKSGWAANG